MASSSPQPITTAGGLGFAHVNFNKVSSFSILGSNDADPFAEVCLSYTTQMAYTKINRLRVIRIKLELTRTSMLHAQHTLLQARKIEGLRAKLRSNTSTLRRTITETQMATLATSMSVQRRVEILSLRTPRTLSMLPVRKQGFLWSLISRSKMRS